MIPMQLNIHHSKVFRAICMALGELASKTPDSQREPYKRPLLIVIGAQNCELT